MYDVMDLLLIANIPIFTVYNFQKTLNTSFDFDLFIIIKVVFVFIYFVLDSSNRRNIAFFPMSLTMMMVIE